MNSVHFIHCRDCDELFRPSPLDRAPEYRVGPDGVVAEARDDCMAFLTAHARHTLETLRPTGTAPAHDRALSDPLKITYWEVSNGYDVMLVRSSRATLNDPLRYTLLPGRLVPEAPSVEIAPDEIRADVDRALYPHAAPHRKLDAFVDCFKAIAWDVDPATLEVVYDLPGDPTLSVAKLPRIALERLAATARRIFDAADAERIAAHLTASADDPETFTVLLRQRIQVR